MLPTSLPEYVLAFSTGGLSIGVGIYMARTMGQAIGWMLTFVTGRYDKREAQLDEATETVIKQLRDEYVRVCERLGLVERDLEECKKHREEDARERNELAKERAELQGLLAGLGGARQHAALIVAAARADDKIGDADYD